MQKTQKLSAVLLSLIMIFTIAIPVVAAPATLQGFNQTAILNSVNGETPDVEAVKVAATSTNEGHEYWYNKIAGVVDISDNKDLTFNIGFTAGMNQYSDAAWKNNGARYISVYAINAAANAMELVGNWVDDGTLVGENNSTGAVQIGYTGTKGSVTYTIPHSALMKKYANKNGTRIIVVMGSATCGNNNQKMLYAPIVYEFTVKDSACTDSMGSVNTELIPYSTEYNISLEKVGATTGDSADFNRYFNSTYSVGEPITSSVVGQEIPIKIASSDSSYEMFIFKKDRNGVITGLVPLNSYNGGGTNASSFGDCRFTMPMSAVDAIVCFDIPQKNADNYYEIYNADQFKWFAIKAYLDPSINAVLKNDIDLGSDFYSVGILNSAKKYSGYSGTFNGENHTITMASHEVMSTTDSGIFPIINNATIKNVKVDGSRSSKAIIGALVTEAYGESCIEDCVNNANVTMNKSSGYVSGIVAKVLGETTVKNCVNNAIVTNQKGNYAAGIVGYIENTNCTIEKCVNTGTVTSAFGTSYIGGIVGMVYSDGYAVSVSECANIGDVVVTASGYPDAGGIIGSANYGVNISDCYNGGNIRINSNNRATGSVYQNAAGGIVGGCGNFANKAFNVQITNSYNSGNVSTVESTAGIGRLVGKIASYVNFTANNCYVLESDSVSILNATNTVDGVSSLDSAALKAAASQLGNKFFDDSSSEIPLNNGYPVLGIQRNVYTPVTGVSLNCENAILEGLGQSFVLDTTVEPSKASNKEVVYTSSNTDVATVDQNGKVLAVAAGEANITVKSVDGEKTDVCVVTVKDSTNNRVLVNCPDNMLLTYASQLMWVNSPNIMKVYGGNNDYAIVDTYECKLPSFNVEVNSLGGQRDTTFSFDVYSDKALTQLVTSTGSCCDDASVYPSTVSFAKSCINPVYTPSNTDITSSGTYYLHIQCTKIPDQSATISFSYVAHQYVETVTNPTCTEDGYTTYVCSKCNDTYTGSKTDALGHEFDNKVVNDTTLRTAATLSAPATYWYTCARCSEVSDTEYFEYGEKLPYEIIKGENGIFTDDGKTALSFTCNGLFSDFTGVKIDGVLVDEDNYIAVSGSTIITFTDDYLASLSAGKHTLTVLYTDGQVDTEFTIVKSTKTVIDDKTPLADGAINTDDTKAPTSEKVANTNDNTAIAGIATVCVLSLGAASTVGYKRKKEVEG